MVINDIDRAEFIDRLSLQSDLEQFIGKEVEWFANPAGNILGTIALGEGRGWNYVVFKRNRLGKFRVRNVVCDFYNHAAARVDFMYAVVRAGGADKDSLPKVID